LFADILGMMLLGCVAAICAWQFRAIVVETSLKDLQRRAVLLLAIGAAGWLLYMLRLGL
jgi:uncharacterized membrane protein YeiH